MTPTQEAAMRQALEALEEINELSIGENAICLPAEIDDAMDALRAALAEHFCDNHCTWLDHAPGCVRAEPVAWLFTHVQSGESDFCFCADEHDHDREMWHKQPLYTASPQRKPLTEEEILKAIGWDRAEMYMKLTPNFPVAEAKKETLKNARAIERAHGIGGQT